MHKLADHIFDDAFEVVDTHNKINNLMKIPKKDKGRDIDYYEYTKENGTHQVDVLYMPNDDGFKYILSVVDTSSRLMDGRALKTLTMKDIIEKLKDIYNGDYLEQPDKIQGDKEFDNEQFKNAFKNSIVRITKVGRHKQQGFVENRNYLLGRILHKRMNSEEIYNNDFAGHNDHYSKSWVKYLPRIIEVINKKFYRKRPVEKDINKPVVFNTKTNGKILTILKPDTKVRVILEEPRDTKDKKLHGRFRASDLRYENKIRTIENIILKPMHPPRYKISGIDNIYYSKNELQEVKDDERYIPSKTIEKYIVEKLLKKKKIKNKIYYLVKWAGYSHAHNTYEPRDNLIADGLQDMIDDFEK
jgi:hypothetical protein